MKKFVFVLIKDYGCEGHAVNSIHATKELAELRAMELEKSGDLAWCEGIIIEEMELEE
ncbi:hypothetical protein vBAbaPP1_158 [Acinetobacter phage vB_AbaM_P1]|nr:hypothetical protein vBAbaPP1_158 [Acinetobacter phage vB_AbaM_P1]WAX22640.1 hypothetical protein [Acinetobacter phage vB_AbaP_HB01]